MNEASGFVKSVEERETRRVTTRPEHVFGESRPFAQCHASSLVALDAGRLLVAWFGGTREGHRDVGIWAAVGSAPVSGAGASSPPHPGEHWSAPRLIAKVDDRPHWNPVLFDLSDAASGDDADLMLHFKVGTRIRDWETWSQRSTDGGQTWSEATPLVPGDRGGRGAVRNKPIRTSSGHWLAGASLEKWKRWDAYIDRSPNGVDDWTAGREIQIDRSRFTGKGLIQPTLWESAPGHVHALFRSTDGWVHRSDSNDDGRTWTRAYPIALPNNNSGLDLVRKRSGLLALACNPVEGNWAARTPLSVLFSSDNGHDWSDPIDLETDPGEFSYPAIIEVEDGLVISYTWNRRRIAVARVKTEEIPAIKASDPSQPPAPSPEKERS